MNNNQQQSEKSHLTKYWLIIGVVDLAIAGLYSLTLVIGRMPIFSENAEIQRIFKDALVVHVNLSVLFWFLAIACLFWSKSSAGNDQRSFIPYTEQAALICFAIATIFMMISPFDPLATAMMSNYIPVIYSPLFFLSLGFLTCSLLIMTTRQLISSYANNYSSNYFSNYFSKAENISALIAIIAIISFVISYLFMPKIIEGEQYYDLLFWAGGHVLQLMHGQFVIMVWIIVLSQISAQRFLEKLIKNFFALNLLLALISLPAYCIYDITSSEFRNFFTHFIMTIGGLAPSIVALLVVYYCWKNKEQRKGENKALWSALLCSSLLFLYGGVLGLFISGQNVVIPAHYHGSIVGITIAFIGFSYFMLPKFGYSKVAAWKIAYWQSFIVAIGQFLHISGLAYSGGYGVLRKTAGGVEELSVNIKIALGFMGIGGLMAIIGGLIFIVIMIRSLVVSR